MGFEERRQPSKETSANTKAITELVTIQRQTTKDVDKLVVQLEKMLPMEEKIVSTNKRIDENDSDIKSIYKLVNPIPSSNTLRWMFGFFIVYSIATGNYVVGHIHTLESDVMSHLKEDSVVAAYLEARLDKVERHLHIHKD